MYVYHPLCQPHLRVDIPSVIVIMGPVPRHRCRFFTHNCGPMRGLSRYLYSASRTCIPSSAVLFSSRSVLAPTLISWVSPLYCLHTALRLPHFKEAMRVVQLDLLRLREILILPQRRSSSQCWILLSTFVGSSRRPPARHVCFHFSSLRFRLMSSAMSLSDVDSSLFSPRGIATESTGNI